MNGIADPDPKEAAIVDGVVGVDQLGPFIGRRLEWVQKGDKTLEDVDMLQKIRIPLDDEEKAPDHQDGNAKQAQQGVA